MGVLGHYLEESGIPTTQISLIRDHTERLRPPRALWVPFDLGRPLGAPGDGPFQTRVLRSALGLLERADRGPVLEDFPEDAPDTAGDHALEGWACPLPLPPHGGEVPDLRAAFEREFAVLLPWYALAVERRGRTTVGLSGLEPEKLAVFVTGFLDDGPPASSREDLPVAMALKFAAQDLRAVYEEAALAKPGETASPGGAQMSRWFWNETRAGQLLRELRQRLQQADDPGLRVVASAMLVPAAELP